jgi:hypothetical protein
MAHRLGHGASGRRKERTGCRASRPIIRSQEIYPNWLPSSRCCLWGADIQFLEGFYKERVESFSGSRANLAALVLKCMTVSCRERVSILAGPAA